MVVMYMFYHKKLIQKANDNGTISLCNAKKIVKLKTRYITPFLAFDILKDMERYGIIKITGRTIKVWDLDKVDKELYSNCKKSGWFKW